MTGERIRWGTDLITFSSTGYWNLGADLPHPQWVAAFNADPRSYLDRMLDGVAAAGLEGVELAPEPADWIAAQRAYGSAAGLREALDARGLTLSSSYAPGRQLIGGVLTDPAAWPATEQTLADHARFISELGSSLIVMGNLARSRFGNDSPDDTATEEDFTRAANRELVERFCAAVNRAAAITGRFGVRIAIHTDAYSICSRPGDIATVLALTDPATVQLCPDAGHIALDGGDPVRVLRDNLDRIPTMHWKDCSAPLSGHLLRGDQKQRHSVMLRNFRVLGSGTIDWASWCEILREHQWSGWATEEIDASPEPVTELRQGLEYFRRALAPIYV